jgi:hypothetical protein
VNLFIGSRRPDQGGASESHLEILGGENSLGPNINTSHKRGVPLYLVSGYREEMVASLKCKDINLWHHPCSASKHYAYTLTARL